MSVENRTGKNLTNVFLESINYFGINPKYTVKRGHDGVAAILMECKQYCSIKVNENKVCK